MYRVFKSVLHSSYILRSFFKLWLIIKDPLYLSLKEAWNSFDQGDYGRGKVSDNFLLVQVIVRSWIGSGTKTHFFLKSVQM